MKQSYISNPAQLNEHLSRKCCRWSPLNLAGVLRERLHKCLMSLGSKRPSYFLRGQEMVNSRFLMQKGGIQSGLRPPSASLMYQSPIIVCPRTGNRDDFNLIYSEFYLWDLIITCISILTRRKTNAKRLTCRVESSLSQRAPNPHCTTVELIHKCCIRILPHMWSVQKKSSHCFASGWKLRWSLEQ